MNVRESVQDEDGPALAASNIVDAGPESAEIGAAKARKCAKERQEITVHRGVPNLRPSVAAMSLDTGRTQQSLMVESGTSEPVHSLEVVVSIQFKSEHHCSQPRTRHGLICAPLVAALTITALGCSGDSATPTSPSAAGTTTALNHARTVQSDAGRTALTTVDEVSTSSTSAGAKGSASVNATPDTTPPSAPTNYCFTETPAGAVLQWSPSVDNVDSPDQITYFLWDVVSAKTGFAIVVGATKFGPLNGTPPIIIVINAVDRAGNASGFVVVVPCTGS